MEKKKEGKRDVFKISLNRNDVNKRVLDYSVLLLKEEKSKFELFQKLINQ